MLASLAILAKRSGSSISPANRGEKRAPIYLYLKGSTEFIDFESHRRSHEKNFLSSTRNQLVSAGEPIGIKGESAEASGSPLGEGRSLLLIFNGNANMRLIVELDPSSWPSAIGIMRLKDRVI